MSAIARAIARPFKDVIIYSGHQENPLLGPYVYNVDKRIQMFLKLNAYRMNMGLSPWEVHTTPGESLIETLKRKDPETTLLVIPAGQSSHLDKVFPIAQTNFIKRDFLERGGRGYFNCGSAYWVSERRIYRDMCLEQPETRDPIEKSTELPLFQGLSEGPLCPFPGNKYKVGFFSDAVEVNSRYHHCTIYLSGGGSFIPKPRDQEHRILVRYTDEELLRLKVPPEQIPHKNIAALMVSVGHGGALLSMFHPYYGPNDVDPEVYEQMFPDSGTDWKRVKNRLSKEDVRLQFALENMILPLERMDFNETPSETNSSS